MADAEKLICAARAAAQTAYAPYSGCLVGAAALFADSDIIYSGCNVENASFGLTICAERSAICAGALAGCRKLTAIAVSVVLPKEHSPTRFMPCGACRQFICEFATDKTRIIVDNYGTWPAYSLLPHAFDFYAK